jgi:anti-sigma factor RsiW
MNQKPVTEALARRFLLGQVDDSERQQIESLFISDPEVKHTILLAEEDLLEDYLEGALSNSDSGEFRLRYAHTSHQRRKLRIAASIHQYALAESLREQPKLSAIQRLRGWVSLSAPRNRGYLIPVTLAVSIVLLVAAVWFVQWHNRRTQHNLSLVVEKELRELNSSSSLAETPAQMLAVSLPPVTLRSVQPAAEVKLESIYPIIELRLLWPQKEESLSYEVVLRRVGSSERFTVPDLHLAKDHGRSIVRLRLPPQHLVPGLYQITLIGAATEGAAAPTEEYTLTVTR